MDKLRVEKERGITVKAQTASMFFNYNGETYLLNLIDTPVRDQLVILAYIHVKYSNRVTSILITKFRGQWQRAKVQYL